MFTAVGTTGASGFNAKGNGDLSDTVNLAPGASITYTATTQVPLLDVESFENSATVTPPANTVDPNPANNTASDSDDVISQVDLAVTVDDGTTTAVPGTSTTYTITITNSGPSSANGVEITDNFPAAITSASYTVVTSSGSTVTSDSGTGDIDDFANILPGGSVTFTVLAQIDPSATGSLTDTATATQALGVTDTDPANNSATDTDTLTPQADLTISKTDGVTSVVPGQSDSYTIVVSNDGPSNALAVQVVDTLPAQGFGNVSSPNVPAGVDFNSVTDIWSIGTLAAGKVLPSHSPARFQRMQQASAIRTRRLPAVRMRCPSRPPIPTHSRRQLN